jgi:RNA polymerase sigma factor (sigma-70 family)
MNFPATPLTLIGRLRQQDVRPLWESSWEEFFDLYHHAVRTCVAGSFHRHGWHGVDAGHVDEVTQGVFHAIFRGTEAAGYDPGKGRFRHYLSTICARRVVDFIRSHKHDALHESLDGHEINGTVADDPFARRERDAFQNALLGTLLAALREQVSPRVYMILELVKLNGENPIAVAEQLGVRRNVVDNSIFKGMQKLREIAQSPEIREEFDI